MAQEAVLFQAVFEDLCGFSFCVGTRLRLPTESLDERLIAGSPIGLP
jgi:hypothetical protein